MSVFAKSENLAVKGVAPNAETVAWWEKSSSKWTIVGGTVISLFSSFFATGWIRRFFDSDKKP